MCTYLIDFENVKSAGLDGIDKIEPADSVQLFWSKRENKITIEMMELIRKSESSIVMHLASTGERDALDHQLCSYLGYLAGAEGETDFVIVSNDKAYDHLIEFWKSMKPEIRIRRVPEMIKAIEADRSNEAGIEQVMEATEVETASSKGGRNSRRRDRSGRYLKGGRSSRRVERTDERAEETESAAEESTAVEAASEEKNVHEKSGEDIVPVTVSSEEAEPVEEQAAYEETAANAEEISEPAAEETVQEEVKEEKDVNASPEEKSDPVPESDKGEKKDAEVKGFLKNKINNFSGAVVGNISSVVVNHGSTADGIMAGYQAEEPAQKNPVQTAAAAVEQIIKAAENTVSQVIVGDAGTNAEDTMKEEAPAEAAADITEAEAEAEAEANADQESVETAADTVSEEEAAVTVNSDDEEKLTAVDHEPEEEPSDAVEQAVADKETETTDNAAAEENAVADSSAVLEDKKELSEDSSEKEDVPETEDKKPRRRRSRSRKKSEANENAEEKTEAAEENAEANAPEKKEVKNSARSKSRTRKVKAKSEETEEKETKSDKKEDSEKSKPAKKPAARTRTKKAEAVKTPAKEVTAEDVISKFEGARGADWTQDVVNFINQAKDKRDLYGKIVKRLGQEAGRSVYHAIKVLK